MQLVALAHDTWFSAVPPGVSGWGVDTNDQAVPFHASARVNSVGFLGGPSLPTVMQLDAAVHETPSRIAPVWASTGVGTVVHAVPLYASAIGCSTVRPVVVLNTWISPTAMQSVLLTHETAFSIAPPPGSDGGAML